MTQTPRRSPAPKPAALQQALGHAISDKRLEVLRRIGASGSISQAAREAGISYKAAWQAIDTLTSLSGVTLVERTVGGSGGGGARITEQGQELLALAEELARAREAVLARHTGAAPLRPGGSSLGVQTSMRNQIPACVERVEPGDRGDPVVDIRLQTDSGQALTSSITRESADLLGLRPGLPVLLLCKATAVDVSVAGASRAGARCELAGKVLRITRGGLRDEVTLVLEGGATWVGFAERPFERRKGQIAVASMDASALVIALPGQ